MLPCSPSTAPGLTRGTTQGSPESVGCGDPGRCYPRAPALPTAGEQLPTLRDAFRRENLHLTRSQPSPSSVQAFLGHATSLCWKNDTVLQIQLCQSQRVQQMLVGFLSRGEHKSVGGKGCPLGTRSSHWAAARLTLSLGRSAALCPGSESRGEQQVRFEWRI